MDRADARCVATSLSIDLQQQAAGMARTPAAPKQQLDDGKAAPTCSSCIEALHAMCVFINGMVVMLS